VARQNRILALIHTASITYDPAEIQTLAPFLQDPDPEIRKAAAEGLIVLGDAAAAPVLRDAARLQSDPRETISLLEAAEYLELPSADPASLQRSRDPSLQTR
jgi:HEAT repeat protein